MDGLHPLAELNVISLDEALLPVGHDGHGLGGLHAVPAGGTGAAHHGVGIGQLDGAVLADHLALDVIAVAVGHLDLHIDEAALLGAHQHHLGVIIALVGVGGLADLHALHVLILVIQQPAADVQLVNGDVGDTVLGLEARALGDVAVAGLDDEGLAQLAGGDDPLHLSVAPIIVAHEAHLHQPLADLLLPADDLLAVLGVLAQGLLTEAPLLLCQSLHDVVVMGRIDGGDDHGLHLRVLDHAVAVVAIGLDAVLGGSLVGGSSHIVADGHDRGAGDRLDNAAAVILADGAAADDADFQNLIHECVPSFI